MKRLILVIYFLGVPLSAYSDGVIDSIVYEYLENKIPVEVFNKNDIPWEYGVYSIKVVKEGVPKFSSTDKVINTVLPIHVDLKARIKKKIGFIKVNGWMCK